MWGVCVVEGGHYHPKAIFSPVIIFSRTKDRWRIHYLPDVLLHMERWRDGRANQETSQKIWYIYSGPAVVATMVFNCLYTDFCAGRAHRAC